MNVSLTKELEQFVAQKVKSGMYQTASEVVRESLRLLSAKDANESLRRDIRLGFEAIEKGDYDDYDETTTAQLATDIKNRGKRRLAAIQAKQKSA